MEIIEVVAFISSLKCRGLTLASPLNQTACLDLITIKGALFKFQFIFRQSVS